jgi:hypothetical protein
MVTPNIKKKRTQIFCRLLQKIPGQEVDSILFLKWGFIATPPDQPADILGILSETEEDTAMTLINKEHARQIQFLLDKHEETITNFATLQIIKLSPAILVSEVLVSNQNRNVLFLPI